MNHEEETFLDLLKSLPHWEFEIALMIIFDVIVVGLLWPRIKRALSHHKSDDEMIADLERRVKSLEKQFGETTK